jgi:hypothetical protein
MPYNPEELIERDTAFAANFSRLIEQWLMEGLYPAAAGWASPPLSNDR